jgi:hypothetical protein
MKEFKAFHFNKKAAGICLAVFGGWFVIALLGQSNGSLVSCITSVLSLMAFAVMFALIAAPLVLFQFSGDYVLSYVITRDHLVIRRMLKDISLPLNSLRSATLDPHVFDGKCWSYVNRSGLGRCGHFWSQRLGFFRSFVRKRQNSVILRFSNRTIVVSPEDPSAFVSALHVPSDPSVPPP